MAVLPNGCPLTRFGLEWLERRVLLSGRPALGAIRWDAWYQGNPYQDLLAPAEYQYRLPFYSTGYGTSTVTVLSDSQPVMEQEIALAKGAGIDYWAFDWYYPRTGLKLDYGLNQYLASPSKTDIKFCLILQGKQLTRTAADFSGNADLLVNLMQQPTYQKVLGNRPLVYMTDVPGLVTTFGSAAAVKSAMDTLRAKTLAAGLASPYLVAQVWQASDGVNAIDTMGFDAMGAYAHYTNGPVQEYPHSALSWSNSSYWNTCAATGKQVVPTVTTGWDNRPRWPTGTNGAVPAPYFTNPTGAELQNDVYTALQWTRNTAGSSPANTVLMYAWNEHDEGGWLTPTVSEGSTRLDAVTGAIASANTSELTNLSFETPPLASGSHWYIVPASGMPGEFGWSSNSSPGQYVVADRYAQHFSAAADGTLATVLSAGRKIWQSTGAAQPYTRYRLNFSLLTGKYTGDTQSTITAELLDGATVLASQTFSTPPTADQWQQFSLVADTGASVSSNLIMRFTGVSGSGWLDKVAITSQPIAKVVGRWIFYNHSAADGNDQGANVADDAALDATRIALLPGGTPGAGNYSGYSRGINGVLIDLVHLPGSASLSAADFGCEVYDSTAGAWVAAPPLQVVSVRPGAGAGASDRVTLIWPDNSISGSWLRVTTRAGAGTTGLEQDDVFFFGSIVADATGDGAVNFADLVKVSQNYKRTGATLVDGDVNGDGVVNFADLVLVSQNYKKALATPPAGFGPSLLMTSEPATPVTLETGQDAADAEAQPSSASAGNGAATYAVADPLTVSASQVTAPPLARFPAVLPASVSPSADVPQQHAVAAGLAQRVALRPKPPRTHRPRATFFAAIPFQPKATRPHIMWRAVVQTGQAPPRAGLRISTSLFSKLPVRRRDELLS